MKCCNPNCCPPQSDYLSYPTNDRNGWPAWEVDLKCIGDYLPGIHNNQCCPCKWDIPGNDCPEATPHRKPNEEVTLVRPGSGREYKFTQKYCECICDETQVKSYLDYRLTGAPCNEKEAYGIDDENNVIYQWRCPDNKPTFDASTCSCKCDVSREDCTSAAPEFISAECVCVCPISRIVCNLNIDEGQYCAQSNPAKPYFDAENCACYCPLTDDDCAANQKVNEDTCECECVLSCPDGDPSKPDLDSTTCECWCDQESKTPCASGTTWDAATCSCIPCSGSCNGCETYDDQCNCVGCADCDQVEYIYTDNNNNDVRLCCHKELRFCVKNGVGGCYDTVCPTGQFFAYSKCECTCGNNKVLCTKESGATLCRTPCPSGQSFDSNCECYVQSLLNSTLLP